MNEKDKFALVRRPSSAVEKAVPGAKRILSGMVVDALDLAKKAASKEVAVADTQLEIWFQTGEKYHYGRGVPQDTGEAVKWYRKAAEQNHAKAQCSLGGRYQYGPGVKDCVEAVKWYRKAAEQNHADAQNNLGCCYEYGRGVEENQVEAVNWYRKAAEQNDTLAQHNLGYCYANGQGVPQDFGEAVKWYRKAAEAWSRVEYPCDELGAVRSLALCYIHGRGVSKDLAEAYMWLKFVAEVANDEVVSLCETMSEGELTEGENRYQRLQELRKEQFGES